MMCLKCGKPVYCVNSRQRDADVVRYRQYKCRWCSEKFYTIEVITDAVFARKKINEIINEGKE